MSICWLIRGNRSLWVLLWSGTLPDGTKVLEPVHSYLNSLRQRVMLCFNIEFRLILVNEKNSDKPFLFHWGIRRRKQDYFQEFVDWNSWRSLFVTFACSWDTFKYLPTRKTPTLTPAKHLRLQATRLQLLLHIAHLSPSHWNNYHFYMFLFSLISWYRIYHHCSRRQSSRLTYQDFKSQSMFNFNIFLVLLFALIICVLREFSITTGNSGRVIYRLSPLSSQDGGKAIPFLKEKEFPVVGIKPTTKAVSLPIGLLSVFILRYKKIVKPSIISVSI